MKLREVFLLGVMVAALALLLPSPLSNQTRRDPQTVQAVQVEGFPFCVQFNSTTDYDPIPCPGVVPTVTPAFTPPPTFTPRPSATPHPTLTPTPDIEATPTIEDTRTPTYTPPPTFTPSPTATPTPPAATCWGTVTANALNARDVPWGTILGQVTFGQILLFDARWYADFWWWRIEFWNGSVNDFVGAWVSSNWIAVGDTAKCSGLPDLTPRTALTVGLHVTNANRAELIAFQDTLNDGGYPSGVKPYVGLDYCLDALLNDNWCVERWPPDHPDRIGGNDPEASARQYMDARNFAVSQLWQASGYSPKLVIELNNESPNEPYWWWNRWFLEAVAYAEQNHWPPLALAGLGPGYGNVVMFTEWKPALMANHARGGYLSSHNYAPIQYCGGDGSLSNGDIYCAFRHRLNYQIIQGLGYDVRILITEASPTDGYQPVTGDTLRDIGRYTCMIRNDPGLYGIFYWNVGDFAPFMDANLGPFLPDLSNAILTCG